MRHHCECGKRKILGKAHLLTFYGRGDGDVQVLCRKWCEGKQEATWSVAVPVQLPKWLLSAQPGRRRLAICSFALCRRTSVIDRVDVAAVSWHNSPREGSDAPVSPCAVRRLAGSAGMAKRD